MKPKNQKTPPKPKVQEKSAKERVMEAGSHNEGRMTYSTSRKAC